MVTQSVGLVGNPGADPGIYRLIRTASSPAESLPLSGRWTCRSPTACRPPIRGFKARSRAGGAPSIAEAGGPDPQRLVTARPVSNRGLPEQVQLPCTGFLASASYASAALR